MQGVVVRIDDRLLHGQVLLGWAGSLQPQRIVLAHDGIAADPVQRELYASLGEGDYEVVVESVAAAASRLASAATAGGTLMIVGSAADALALTENNAPLTEVNVGGLHYSAGKKRLLDYVYLDHDEATQLATLIERGVHLEARDLPGARALHIDRRMLEELWT